MPGRYRDKKGMWHEAEHPVVAFAGALSAFSSNLYHWLCKRPHDLKSLKVVARDDGTFLAILVAWDEVGACIVCFGSGATFLLALHGLGQSIAANRWREDKPWQPTEEE